MIWRWSSSKWCCQCVSNLCLISYCVRIRDKVLDSFIFPLATDSAQHSPCLFHRCIMIQCGEIRFSKNSVWPHWWRGEGTSHFDTNNFDTVTFRHRNVFLSKIVGVISTQVWTHFLKMSFLCSHPGWHSVDFVLVDFEIPQTHLICIN